MSAGGSGGDARGEPLVERRLAVRLERRAVGLERATLGWNVAGVAVLAVTGLLASSVALIAFGLDSLIEIGASIVVLWELAGAGEARQRRALSCSLRRSSCSPSTC